MTSYYDFRLGQVPYNRQDCTCGHAKDEHRRNKGHVTRCKRLDCACQAFEPAPEGERGVSAPDQPCRGCPHTEYGHALDGGCMTRGCPCTGFVAVGERVPSLPLFDGKQEGMAL